MVFNHDEMKTYEALSTENVLQSEDVRSVPSSKQNGAEGSVFNTSVENNVIQAAHRIGGPANTASDAIPQAGELAAEEEGKQFVYQSIRPSCLSHPCARRPVTTKPASPAATEIVPIEEHVIPFESCPYPGVKARDYAFQPNPIRPPLFIFPIVASYIWFSYNRWRVIKQMPPIYIDAWVSAFTGCELVYLMHFNWINMKDICWKDARDWFGQGLVYLYEHPRDVQIDYGAKRPSLKSPLVRKWWSRFSESKTMRYSALTVRPRSNREFEKREFDFYGPFGKTIHFYFSEEDKPTLWKLHNYLLGKGPKPDLTEKMEKVFEPVFKCYDGSIGGRGKPYERPRAKNDPGPREGTEPEHVNVNPELISVEFAKTLPFGIVRREIEKEQMRKVLRARREAKAKLAEEQELTQTEKAKKSRGNKWTHKKSRKASADKKLSTSDEVELIVFDAEPNKRVTRSMAKDPGTTRMPFKPDAMPRAKVSMKKMKEEKLIEELLKETDALSNDKEKDKAKAHDAPGERDDAAQETEHSLRKDKGKGKEVTTPMYESFRSTSDTCRRNDDEYLEYECIEPSPSEAGPSNRPIRYVQHRVRIPGKVEPSRSQASDWSDVTSAAEEARGLKRKRNDEPKPERDTNPLKRRRAEAEVSPEERLQRFEEGIENILSRRPQGEPGSSKARGDASFDDASQGIQPKETRGTKRSRSSETDTESETSGRADSDLKRRRLDADAILEELKEIAKAVPERPTGPSVEEKCNAMLEELRRKVAQYELERTRAVEGLSRTDAGTAQLDSPAGTGSETVSMTTDQFPLAVPHAAEQQPATPEVQVPQPQLDQTDPTAPLPNPPPVPPQNHLQNGVPLRRRETTLYLGRFWNPDPAA
ncbi:hypothetical protein ACEPAH_9559 [Sanghuangporus vaninii]